jgi:hypothetical protein
MPAKPGTPKAGKGKAPKLICPITMKKYPSTMKTIRLIVMLLMPVIGAAGLMAEDYNAPFEKISKTWGARIDKGEFHKIDPNDTAYQDSRFYISPVQPVETNKAFKEKREYLRAVPSFHSDEYKKMVAVYRDGNGKDIFVKMKLKDIIAQRKKYVDTSKVGQNIANFYIWHPRLGKMLWVRAKNDEVEFLCNIQPFVQMSGNTRAETVQDRATGMRYKYETKVAIDRISMVPIYAVGDDNPGTWYPVTWPSFKDVIYVERTFVQLGLDNLKPSRDKQGKSKSGK